MLHSFRRALSQRAETERPLIAALGLIRHLVGPIRTFFDRTADGRRADRIDYPIGACAFLAFLMFICQMPSRKRMNVLLRTRRVAKVFERIFENGSVPHGDTVADALEASDPASVEALRIAVIQELLRRRSLEPYRLLGIWHVIAIDGTEILSWKHRHCPHCLTRSHDNGTTTYHHQSEEAVLVGRGGIALPVMTEFIENACLDPDVQDVEHKAFHRLIDRLASSFPRLPILLSLDGLYANGPVFARCRRNNWRFMVTLKPGSLTDVNGEFERLTGFQRDNCLVRRVTLPQAGALRLRWVNGIVHIDSNRHVHHLSVLDGVCQNREGAIIYRFRWATDLKISAENAEAFFWGAGRIRWNIEENFKVQKVDGFHLEHAFSHHPVASKMFHHFLLLAVLVMHLLHKSTLGRTIVPVGSVTYALLAYSILEALRHASIEDDDWRLVTASRLQIRFADDS